MEARRWLGAEGVTPKFHLPEEGKGRAKVVHDPLGLPFL